MVCFAISSDLLDARLIHMTALTIPSWYASCASLVSIISPLSVVVDGLLITKLKKVSMSMSILILSLFSRILVRT